MDIWSIRDQSASTVYSDHHYCPLGTAIVGRYRLISTQTTPCPHKPLTRGHSRQASAERRTKNPWWMRAACVCDVRRVVHPQSSCITVAADRVLARSSWDLRMSAAPRWAMGDGHGMLFKVQTSEHFRSADVQTNNHGRMPVPTTANIQNEYYDDELLSIRYLPTYLFCTIPIV